MKFCLCRSCASASKNVFEVERFALIVLFIRSVMFGFVYASMLAAEPRYDFWLTWLFVVVVLTWALALFREAAALLSPRV